MTTTLVANASAQTLPAGWTVSNIGNPAISGSATFSGGTFSVSGAGTDVGGSSDQFTFIHRQVPGDTTFVARVASLQNVGSWSKAGVMIRESLAAGSKHAFAFVTPGQGVNFRRRTSTGGTTANTKGGSGTAPVWLKLERRSTTVTAYSSTNGATWSQVGNATVSMSSTVYVGLAVTSRDASRIAAATFMNVSEALPSGWTAADIGGPGVAGSTQYSSTGGTFTLNGSGEVGGTWDRFHFAYRQVSGDVDIRARVVSVQSIQLWSKAGVMVRETLNADAVNGLMFISGASGSAFHQRASTGAMRLATEGTAVAPPYWVRLERRGSTLTGSQSSDGVTWITVGTMTLSSPTVYVGLVAASSDATQLTTGIIDNVAVTVPASNQPPAVSLTAPAIGATFTAPATIDLTATASDSDGTIAKVEFYAGTTLIGTDTTSPYGVTWSGAAAGSYQLTAVAKDDDAAATTSAARSVTVSTLANQPPAVSLTAPASGATFTAPATITVSATASDTDGTVASVEFYAGMILIASDTSSPYSVTWSGAPAGTYWVTARARDNAGTITTSASRSVTMTGGLPAGWTASDIGGPSVAGSTQYAGGTGTYTLKGSGEIGSTADRFHFAYRQANGDIDIRARVVSVQNIQPWSKAGVMVRETVNADAANGLMFISGVSGSAFHQRQTTGAMRVPTEGTAVAPPYWVRLERRGSLVTGSQSSDGVTWTTIGTMTLASPTVYIGLAVASADANQLATAVVDNVAVTVPAQAPLVSLTAPAAGTVYTSPATVALTATASDPDGSVAQVDFYAGSTLIGSDTTSPYGISWSNVLAGVYSLTAVARDNSGATTVSGARDIRVDDPTMPRTATFTASANHDTTVDRYFLEIFPVGANPLVANPIATRDLGKPPVVSGQCTVDISATTVALPGGSYIATVTAIGGAGSARSAASPAFVR